MDKNWFIGQLYICTKDYTNILNKGDVYFKDSLGRMVDYKRNRLDLKKDAIKEHFVPVAEAYEEAVFSLANKIWNS